MTAATTPATDAEIAEWLETVEKYPSLKKQKGTFAHRLIARIHQEREKAIRECASTALYYYRDGRENNPATLEACEEICVAILALLPTPPALSQEERT